MFSRPLKGRMCEIFPTPLMLKMLMLKREIAFVYPSNNKR